jgi:uracil-DNA glycosylase
MADTLTDRRGDPWEYDPGPPRNRRWPRLFAATPNYRAIGVAYTGVEEFRWHQGPMFYRGRLGDDQVRVLVVGQEGAQDESLSHRSFTGGTGARMQHVLHHIGIDRSYLFLNTFVYPIFGQYNGKLPELAQHPTSPIARHRNELFDYALERNDIRLVIAVGNAAKESIATWIRTRGGTANPASLHTADHHVLGPRVRALGMLHPGSQSAELESKFRAEVRRIERWEDESPGWLPTDPGMQRRPARDYAYRSAPIPFRDFAYGTTWRLGRGGTSSNRSSNQQSIQIFGQRGRYNNRDVSYGRSPSSSHQDPLDVTPSGDLAYEPPRSDHTAYDRGPSRSFARLLQGGSTGRRWPDFAASGLGVDPAFGTGPTHRGRLRRGQLVLVADQQSADDLFVGRALCGDVGQHLQSLLRAIGLTRSYSIIRTLPVHTSGERSVDVAAAVDDPAVRAIHREVLRRLAPAVLATLGPGAERVVAAEAPPGIPVVHLAPFDESDPAAAWRPAVDQLEAMAFPRDIAHPSHAYAGDREPIPRSDLPFGTLRWQATTGDRAQQGRLSGRVSPDYFRVSMPIWTSRLRPAPLSPSEADAVGRLP